MLPLMHAVAGGIFSTLIYIIFGIGLFEVSIVFFSSFLIDIDHYACYVLWKKDFSLRNARKWFLDDGKRYDKLSRKERKGYSLGIFPLHGFEILLIVFLLGFWNSAFYFVFIGFGFHLVGDFVHELFHAKRALYRFSLIYSLLYRWPKD